MRKRRYEILLPIRFNDGRPVSGELLEQTREELMAHFRAVQIQPHTVLGLWLYEGTRYEDELRGLTVDVEDNPENQEFFATFKQKLLERFEQPKALVMVKFMKCNNSTKEFEFHLGRVISVKNWDQKRKCPAPLTLFTWGYWGWGSATKQLVQGIDAVEKSRGYKPPLFIDIRLERSGRAVGFQGDAFRETVGDSRYKWLGGLGNLAIKEGGPMRIKEPCEACTLLHHAEAAYNSGRRVIFFCDCKFPNNPEKNRKCHRCMVAGLVLKEARRRNFPMQIVEWPGDDPRLDVPEIEVSDKIYRALLRARKSIPLPAGFSLAEMAGLPWQSIVAVRPEGSNAESARFFTGPARFKNGEWYLPVLDTAPAKSHELFTSQELIDSNWLGTVDDLKSIAEKIARAMGKKPRVWKEDGKGGFVDNENIFIVVPYGDAFSLEYGNSVAKSSWSGTESDLNALAKQIKKHSDAQDKRTWISSTAAEIHKWRRDHGYEPRTA